MSVRPGSSSGRMNQDRLDLNMSLDGFNDNDEEKDESKRKSRNLSEKKRRDQFNTLVTELGTLVTSSNRKMDKTSILKTAISFLRQHNERTLKSECEDLKEEWKPPFLCNQEFTHLMLEALDEFIIVLGTDGHILYTSESLAGLLGYLPSRLHNTTLYDLVGDGDKISLYNHLNISSSIDTSSELQLKIRLHIRRSLHIDRRKRKETEEEIEQELELVELSGYFRKWISPDSGPDTGYISDDDISLKSGYSNGGSQVPRYRPVHTDKTVFLATGRLVTPQLIRELPVVNERETEFTSRHSLEWKFLFLDHRAPPIIGYLPFELLGTSGYDYYHADDLDQVAECHRSLRQTGECTSCYYRFLTKGQQWIWLQTRYFITYHQWNSKPEFIVATHKVVNYEEVLISSRKQEKTESLHGSAASNRSGKSFRSGSPTWSSMSSLCGSTSTGFASSSKISQEPGEQMNFQGGYRARNSRGSSRVGSIGMTSMQLLQEPQFLHDQQFMSESMSVDSRQSSVHSSMYDPQTRAPAIIVPHDHSSSHTLLSIPPSSLSVLPTPSSPSPLVSVSSLLLATSCQPPLVLGSSLLLGASSSPISSTTPFNPHDSSSSPAPTLHPSLLSPLLLSPAQLQLQRQLRSKHAELSRRIQLQQQELLKLGEQLDITQQRIVSTEPKRVISIQPGGEYEIPIQQVQGPPPSPHPPTSDYRTPTSATTPDYRNPHPPPPSLTPDYRNPTMLRSLSNPGQELHRSDLLNPTQQRSLSTIGDHLIVPQQRSLSSRGWNPL